MAFGCLQLGLPADQVRARVDDVLALLGIADLIDRAPFQLSGGQKKRVAIASVLVMNPDVLLFDEPTAALDPRTQQWLIELIVELSAAGKTIVLATHDLEALELLADRGVVFAEDHTIDRVGTPGEILTDHDLLHRSNLVHDHSRIPRLPLVEGVVTALHVRGVVLAVVQLEDLPGHGRPGVCPDNPLARRVPA